MFQVIENYKGHEIILATYDNREDAYDALCRYHDDFWMESGREPKIFIYETNK